MAEKLNPDDTGAVVGCSVKLNPVEVGVDVAAADGAAEPNPKEEAGAGATGVEVPKPDGAVGAAGAADDEAAEKLKLEVGVAEPKGVDEGAELEGAVPAVPKGEAKGADVTDVANREVAGVEEGAVKVGATEGEDIPKENAEAGGAAADEEEDNCGAPKTEDEAAAPKEAELAPNVEAAEEPPNNDDDGAEKLKGVDENAIIRGFGVFSMQIGINYSAMDGDLGFRLEVGKADEKGGLDLYFETIGYIVQIRWTMHGDTCTRFTSNIIVLLLIVYCTFNV